MTVSVILPVINETYSLTQTIDKIEAESDIHQFLIVICSRTTPESRAVIETLVKTHPNKINVHTQTLPFIGGAMREAFELCTG